MKFSSSISDIDETLRGVYEYPDYGDLTHIRPFIRASEIAPDPKKGTDSSWPKSFWQLCFDNTKCMPEEAISEKIQNRQKTLSNEMEKARKHYFKETVEIRNKVIDHFFASSKSSSIDPRYEGTFGLALYGVSLFIEIIFYRASLSITGRVALRALVETYITFKYLLKKEKTEKEVWSDYRGYGTGQLKLLYLKLVELGKEIGSIEVDTLDELANEDKSVEFTPIHIGHWDSANLRKISEEIGAKDLYDTYYGYTSGFMHASWSAVRESVYQRCLNPLHRLHRVPTYDLPLMPSVTKDAREIVNMILGCLHEAYPKFDYRFTEIDDKLKDMKTILVDAVDCFVIEETDGSFKIFKEMQELLDSLPNTKIILTGANDEQFKRFGLDKMPYEVFTLKHNPEKTESKYFSMMLDHLKLSKQGVVYFEHNPDAVKSAQSVGIKTYFYDNSKKDLVSLKKFIEENA